MSDFASLSLFAATPDQVLASRKRTWVQWARGMTVEEYLYRDASMDVMDHAANGKLTTWVLAPRNDPETLDFKCSCETYLRKGFAVQPSESGSPITSEVQCYGIASVFTPVPNRSKGYAKHMMRLLHWVMAPHAALPPFPNAWGAPPEATGKARFSVLYSDIGDFYLLCGPTEEAGKGWAIRDAIWTLWDVGWASESTGDEPGELEWLDIPGVNKLLGADSETMKRDVVEWTKSTGRTSVAFLPWEGVGLYQIQRVLFSSPVPQITKWGVLLKDASSKDGDRPTFAAWSIDKGPSSMHLVIIRLRATQTTFPHLLRKILEVAREHGLEKVEVWNLPMELVGVASELGGQTTERDMHLPSFVWYGDGQAANIDWLFNEKFPWC